MNLPPLKNSKSKLQTPQKKNHGMRLVAMYSGVGVQIVFSILLCLWGGKFLDTTLGSAPLFLLLGLALGFGISGYQLYRLVQIEKKQKL